MELSFLEIYTLLAVFHCFVLSLVILLSKFFRSAVNQYLGFSLLFMATVGLNHWFWDMDRHPLLIHMLDVPLWQFLYPVTLFVFFYKATHARELTYSEKVLLYAPFGVLSFCNLILMLDHTFHLISLPIPDKDLWVFYFYNSVNSLSVIFPLVYTILSFRFVFSKRAEKATKWLKLIFVFVTVLILYGILLKSYQLIYEDKMPLTYLWVLLSFFSYWLIYHGIYRFRLSNEQYEIRQLLKSSGAVASAGQTDAATPYLSRFEKLLKEEGIYRNPHLSRDEVAESLGISGGYLSQLLNTNNGKSFSDYINACRVEEVKRMIQNPDFEKYNLLSIGLEAGFNSKTAFYASFKKETGMTPSEYKKKKLVPNS